MKEGVGPVVGQSPVDIECLLFGVQGLFPPTEVTKPEAEVVQTRRQVGQEGVGSVVGQSPVGIDGFPCGMEGFFPPAERR